MKSLIKIFALALLPLYSASQVNPLFTEPAKKQADSLSIILRQTTNDTVKMATLREFALYYLDINSDSSLYFIEMELPLVKKLQLKLWEADALDLYGIILTNLGNYPKALKTFNEAIKIAEDKESEKNIWRISKFTYTHNSKIARLNMLAAIQLDFALLYRETDNVDKQLTAIQECIYTATLINDTPH